MSERPRLSSEINRREFVVIGGTAVVATAVGLPARAAQNANDTEVSVGYFSGAPGISRRFHFTPTFVDASSVLSGEPSFFSNDPVVRVAGYWRAETASSDEFVSLDVLYEMPGYAEKAAFFAWSGRVRGARLEGASPVRFRVPVAAVGTTDLIIQRTAPGAAPRRSVVSFAVNSGVEGTLRLNRGLYAFALLRAGEPAPDWRAVEIASDRTSEKTDLTRESLLVDALGNPVTFDYLLLSVS